MIDRRVTQIQPVPKEDAEERVRRFSEYATHSNIVLLGDPGSGKSHLFQSDANRDGALFLNARAFLNKPAFPKDSVLFIDALDERRAGRGDQDTVDAVVKKLFEVQPSKVRISCRVADWLGDTDLAAFRDYFDDAGGVVVLGLQTLHPEEQLQILETHRVADPQAFLKEAARRGMSEFLRNSQNLLLLAKAVEGGRWPETRAELFDLATSLLLREANKARARAGSGQYESDELRAPAGAISAVRLISDVSGICLAENSDNPDFPSFRTLTLVDHARCAATLTRRVFEAVSEAECVDYNHRTVAEYVAARWIAEQVRGGLPIGRVRALTSVDGHPTSELRGLHAWLAVHLPDHANDLIGADPYGVLTYGDAASMSTASRRHLVAALAALSASNPRFRSGAWESPGIASLAKPDMVDTFQAILRSPHSDYGIRSIVVDALAAGPPLHAMQDDLLASVWRTESTLAERFQATKALLKMGPAARTALVQSYRKQPVDDGSTLQLNSFILASLYAEHFQIADAIALLNHALHCEHELPLGVFSNLVSAIPHTDIPLLLDAYPQASEPLKRLRRNAWELSGLFERLLLRLFHESEASIDPGRLLNWLKRRSSLREGTTGSRSEEIVAELRGRKDLLSAMIDHLLDSMPLGEGMWWYHHAFQTATFNAVTPELLHSRILKHLEKASPDREHALYHLAFDTVHGSEKRFEETYFVADQRPHLAAIREQRTVAAIDDRTRQYQLREAQRKEAEAKVLEENVRGFEQAASDVRSGAHLGYLQWAAQIYLCLFSGLDPADEPLQRLTQVLGETNAEVAIQGFISLLDREDLPSLTDVLALTEKNQFYEWWYAIIAGLDEAWKQRPSLGAYRTEILLAALAFDLTHPTFEKNDGHAERRSHEWKDAVLLSAPELARQAYSAVAQVRLTQNAPHIDGLSELITEEAFRPFWGEIVLQFLREHPNAPSRQLQRLLKMALTMSTSRSELLDLARVAIDDNRVSDDRRDLWLAAAYLAEPTAFAEQVKTYVERRLGIIWALRDLSGYRHPSEEEKVFPLQIDQMELIARLVGRQFENASLPSVGWSGDSNVWDAADYVRALISAISAVATEDAAGALERLEADRQLVTYRGHIKGSIASQHNRMRDAAYRQPSWKQTIDTLHNGPPASVPDLHALLVDQLTDIANQIASGNTDIYKRFWNEDSYGRPTEPKSEESCRDVLVDLLRAKLTPLGITVEPEGHMASDERADIAVFLAGKKVLVELKRDFHRAVWRAAEGQLENYTKDPDSTGFGVYGVFWFSDGRRDPIPLPPGGGTRPTTPGQMKSILVNGVPAERRHRISVAVIDVAPPVR